MEKVKGIRLSEIDRLVKYRNRKTKSGKSLYNGLRASLSVYFGFTENEIDEFVVERRKMMKDQKGEK